MAKVKEPRFRITVWPEVPVSPPEVWVFEASVDGDAIVYDCDWEDDFSGELVELPEELVIRELIDLNLEDAEAIAEFVGTYGAIVRPRDSAELPSWLFDPMNGADRVAVADVREWLQRAAVLAGHYVKHSRGDDVCDPWRRYGLTPIDEVGAWEYFTVMLNQGLSAFQVRVELHRTDDEGIDEPQGVPILDLFEALCLQLHQLIVSDLPVLECANETCYRPFVRQRGTAEYGQYRTRGVAYCSRACAKAQVQREYRKRKRDKEQG